jgi:hypothetical protein
MGLWARFERWMHQRSVDATICTLIDQIIQTDPKVSWKVKEMSGYAHTNKRAPLEEEAFFIGYNLYIGRNENLQGEEHFCIWTAESPDVHIHKATQLFRNKVLIHGEWEHFVVRTLMETLDRAVAAVEKQKADAKQLDADRLAYFSHI